MNKAAIERILDKLLENAVGAKIWFSDPEGKELKRAIEEIPKFARAIKASNHFVIKHRSHKGRRFKYVAIEMYNKKTVGVTKTAIRQAGKKFNKREAVIKTLRELIEYQITDFRRNNAMWTRGSHVDHEIPFIKLACDWIVSQGWESFEDVPGYKSYMSWIIDTPVANSWRIYHKEKASLKVKEAHINLSEGAKEFIAPF